MATQYQKEDDYTLLVTNTLPTGGTVSRLFNFAAQHVTTVFRERAELQKDVLTYASNGGNAVARAVALTSQMQIQKFSEFDSRAEIEILRAELVKRGGHPPEPEALDKPRATVAKLG